MGSRSAIFEFLIGIRIIHKFHTVNFYRLEVPILNQKYQNHLNNWNYSTLYVIDDSVIESVPTRILIFCGVFLSRVVCYSSVAISSGVSHFGLLSSIK